MEYKFDRYIDGKLMAEGVVIEKANSFADAAFIASKIARLGQNGQPPVLVLSNGNEDIKRLETALREIYEIYAGSEGIPQPMTAAEGYLLHLVKEMANTARTAIREKKR